MSHVTSSPTVRGAPPRVAVTRDHGQLFPLYPMTVADILDGAFRTWRAVAGTAVLLVLAIMGPYELIQNLVLFRVFPELVVQDPLVTATDIVDLRLIGVSVAFALVGVLVWIYAASAVVTLVVGADRGESIPIGRVLRSAVVPALVALVDLILLAIVGIVAFILAVLVALIPFLGVIVLLFAGPIGFGAAVALTALVVPIAVVERRGPVATLGRALWVLRVRFWRTIGITWLMLIVLLGVMLGLALLLELAAGAAGPADWMVFAVSGVLVSVLQVPVLSYAALLVFLDARIVREGYDLEVRTARVAGV